MNNKTEIEFVVNRLTRKFFKWGLSDEELNDWVDELFRFTPEIITDAFQQHIKLKKGMKPNLADILGYCFEIRDRNIEQEVAQYAEALYYACQFVDPRDNISLGNNTANLALLNMGGFSVTVRYNGVSGNPLERFLNDFKESYKKTVISDDPRVCPFLNGISDTQYITRDWMWDGGDWVETKFDKE